MDSTLRTSPSVDAQTVDGQRQDYLEPKAVHSVAVIGVGSVGASWCALFLAHGLEVIAHDPALRETHPVFVSSGVRPVALAALTAEADVISLHVPLLLILQGWCPCHPRNAP